MAQARAAKEIVKRLLAGVSGVAGIGITWGEDGQPAVLVNVQESAKSRVKILLEKAPIDIDIVLQEVSTITLEDA